jgi:hypothetical protein
MAKRFFKAHTNDNNTKLDLKDCDGDFLLELRAAITVDNNKMPIFHLASNEWEDGIYESNYRFEMTLEQFLKTTVDYLDNNLLKINRTQEEKLNHRAICLEQVANVLEFHTNKLKLLAKEERFFASLGKESDE